MSDLRSPTGSPEAPSLPAGCVLPFAGPAAPSGYLLCDGSTVSRTTYAALFAAIGTVYGAGDGSTTFGLPDMQGRMPVGKGTHADVDALGESDGAVLADRRPKHKHTINETAHGHGITDPQHSHTTQNYNTPGGASTSTGTGASTVAGSGTNAAATGISVVANVANITVGPQTNVPTDGAAYLVLNYVIKT